MPNEVEIIVRVIDMASRKLEEVGAKAEASGKPFGKLAKVGGMALVGLGVAAAAAAVESVKMASSFQSSMEQLATQAHVPQKAVDQLSQSVLGLAGKVGVGPESLSEALYHIESSFASTGITGGKAMHLLETSAKGAQLGHANLVDVTNALDAAVVSGIPGVKNFDQAMGMLNATVGAGDMHMQDLAAAFGTGAVAVVKNYGLSLRDVGAALAVFGDNNIRGSKAGTQLRMTVQSLAVPAAGGKKALAELGLQSTTLAKDMQTGGLIKAVTDLHDRLHKAGFTAKTSGEILTEAFGKKAGVGLAMLVDQFDRLKSKYKEIDKGANGFADAWKKQQSTFAQGWDQVKAAVESAMIQMGLKLLPLLKKLLPAATDIATGAIHALSAVLVPLLTFLSNHTGILKAAAVIIGTTLVLAFTAWAVAAAEAAVATIAATWPVLAITAAIALLAAGLIYAWTHWSAFRTIVIAVAGALRTAAVSTISLGGILIRIIGAAVAYVIDRFGDMATFVGAVLSHIPGMGAAGHALQSLGAQAHAAAQKVRDVANAMANITSKSVTLSVNYRTTGAPPGVLTGGHLTPFAHGGIVGAAATGGPRSGPVLVGENGPELVDLAPGSTVHSAADTATSLAGWTARDYTRNHLNRAARLAKEHHAHAVHMANEHALHELHDRDMGLHDLTPAEGHLAHLRRLGSEGKLPAHLQHQYDRGLGRFRRHHRAAAAAASSLPAGTLTPADYTTGSVDSAGTPTKIVVELDIRSGGTQMDDFLVQLLRKAIRTRGGNVQTVLGR